MSEKNKRQYYEEQKILLDIAVKILKEGFKERKLELKQYQKHFFVKAIPPFIAQPLSSLRNKITFKPVYKKIEADLGISDFKAKRLVKYNGFGFVLKSLPKIKVLMTKYQFDYITKNLSELLKDD